jgi:hypothetical protein
VKKDGQSEKVAVEVDKAISPLDALIAHLTRKCRANLRERHVGGVPSGSFEEETRGADPHSEACDDKDWTAAKTVVDLEADLGFFSVYRGHKEYVRHTKDN